MPIYDLPIWAHDRDEFPDLGIGGPGWRVGTWNVTIAGPVEREAHFLAMRERYPQYSVTYLDFDHETSRVAPQLFVEAKSRIVAQRVCDLIRAAMCLVDGSNTFDLGDLLALPHNSVELEDLTEYDLRGNAETATGRHGVLLATRLVAKCSLRNSLRYALLKLNLSFQLASANWMHLDPSSAPKNFRVESDAKIHVALATAATLAYSAIEELQLEPRPVNNRNVKNPDGTWDPTALADLKARLEAARIDIQEPLVWTVRGNTRIHRSKRAPEGAKQPWARGIVRDASISVQDALVAASWLRSKCTTHRYGKETSSITMFDVHNVQFLARRLIMETVGLLPPM